MEELAELLEIERDQQVVPLDHALVLVKHMMRQKTKNLALHAHIKNMEALLQSNHIGVPLMKSSVTPERKDSL